MRICPFDIENMYAYTKCNIIDIINSILETAIEPNCFQFDHQYYEQADGLAMTTSTSSVLAETYIQHK
jgi:hypothetical protein